MSKIKLNQFRHPCQAKTAVLRKVSLIFFQVNSIKIFPKLQEKILTIYRHESYIR